MPRDLEYYIRSGGSLSLGHAIGLGLGLLTTYVFTNFTSQRTYAHFGYVLAVLSVASLAALPGVDSAILHAVARGRAGALGPGTRLRLKASFLGTFGMLLWSALLGATGRRDEAAVVAWCSLLVPLIYPFTSVFSFLQGQGRFVEYTLANLAIEIAKTAAVALAALALGLDGTPVILAPFLAMGLGYFLLTRYYDAGAPTFEPGPEFRSLGRALTGAAALGTIAGQVDRFLVGTFFGPAAMAAYHLAFSLTYPLRGFGTLAGQLLFPRIVSSGSTAPGFRRKYGLGLSALATALIGLVAGYWLIFPVIQRHLFPGYEDAVPIARWLIVATSLAIFDTVAGQALWGLEDLRGVKWTQSFFPLQRMAFLAMGGYAAGVPGILAGQVAHYALSASILIGFWVRGFRPRGSP